MDAVRFNDACVKLARERGLYWPRMTFDQKLEIMRQIEANLPKPPQPTIPTRGALPDGSSPGIGGGVAGPLPGSEARAAYDRRFAVLSREMFGLDSGRRDGGQVAKIQRKMVNEGLPRESVKPPKPIASVQGWQDYLVNRDDPFGYGDERRFDNTTIKSP